MAFELVGPTRSVTIDLRDELVFDLARMLQPSLPMLQQLDAEFYDYPKFSVAEAERLAAEFTQLKASLTAQPDAAHAVWQARPPLFRTEIMPHPPSAADLAAKLEALAATCRDVVAHGGVLRGLSD